MNANNLFVAAVCALCASTARAGGEVELSIAVDIPSSTWEVFAEITDTTSDVPGSEIVGISVFAIDVVGADGITVTSSLNESPVDTISGAGFGFFRTNGDEPSPPTPIGVNIGAAQLTLLGNPSLILTDVGLAAGTQGDASWGLPVKLASGEFSGTVGTLSVTSPKPLPDLTGFALLTGTAGVWNQGNPESAAVVKPATIAIPEPASCLLMLVGTALGVGMRRMRS